MNHEYDVFEKFSDGSSLWRASVLGLEGTRLYMSDLARLSPNKFYAMDVMSGKIVLPDLRQGAFQAVPKMGKQSKGAVA